MFHAPLWQPAELAPLAALFDAGQCAVIANVGPLVVPTDRTTFNARSVPLPPKLFSHNDQQSVWQASVPEDTKRTSSTLGTSLMISRARSVSSGFGQP